MPEKCKKDHYNRLLTPANYNIMQFVNDIKKKYQVDASQGLFLYVNSEKLMGQGTEYIT